MRRFSLLTDLYPALILRLVLVLSLCFSASALFSGPVAGKDEEEKTSPLQKTNQFIDIKEIRSPGGLTAWLVEDHSVPVIAMAIGFKNAGSKMDTPEKQGLAQLASNTMDEGAGDLDSQTFQGALQNLSISLSFSSGRDNFGASLKTLTQNKERAFELLHLALTRPRFDPEPVERMKIANLSRVKRSMSEPDWIASRIQFDRIFEGHPYAQNSGGTLSTLQALTPDDLRIFVKRLGRNNLQISVAGDITAEELSNVLDSVFGTLPEAALSQTKPTTLANPGKTYFYEKDVPQTVIEMSQPGIARKDPDYQTAQVMNYVLGASGFGSRLTEEVREKRGLTYGIYSYFMDYEDAHVLHVSTSTATASVKEVIGLIRSEWSKMIEGDVSEKELQDAKNYLIGSLPLSMTSTDKTAGLLLSIQMDDLPIDYLDKRQKAIEKTTIADIRRVAERILNPELFTTVLVGEKQDIEGAEKIENLKNVE